MNELMQALWQEIGDYSVQCSRTGEVSPSQSLLAAMDAVEAALAASPVPANMTDADLLAVKHAMGTAVHDALFIRIARAVLAAAPSAPAQPATEQQTPLVLPEPDEYACVGGVSQPVYTQDTVRKLLATTLNGLTESETLATASVAGLSAPAQPATEQQAGEWDETCVLGHCGSPSGCERDMQCRANLATPPQEPQAEQSEDGRLLDWLRDESCDLRCISVPTDNDDHSVHWQVVGHWQAKPHERVVGESYTDEPRDAIRAAIAAKEQS